MQNLLLTALALVGAAACASTPTSTQSAATPPEAAQPDATSEPEVIVQWVAEKSFLGPQPATFIGGRDFPGLLLEIDAPFGDRPSLQAPEDECPTRVMRVRGDGDLERALRLPDEGLTAPTLGARCFRLTPPDASETRDR